jgi:serine/threonine protein kinase
MSMIGKTLGHYEITSQLGKGGMGEVFQAKDQVLGRDVAIKVLPEEFARDADRVARFQREAKVLASLNHPNIAAIHGLEESGGTNFLVLELVEGETLADQIKRGPIPVEDALKLALQIADALEAAHEKGVIHRDLKPANIKVTPEVKAKVLDFGLAKAYVGDQADLNLSNSPTLSNAATQQGVILGTAAYMSPEQARGKAVDKRADIWAFGCVLSEMLTGQQTWSGATVTDIIAAALAKDPDFTKLPPDLHPRIRELLNRCLQKDPAERFRDVGDVRIEIRQLLADPKRLSVQPAAAAEPHKKLQLTLLWAAISLILIIAAGVAVWYLKKPEARPVTRLYYELPKDQQFSNPFENNIAVSPDGRQFEYATNNGLYLRSMDELEARLISGTAENPQKPFYSPDGKWIGCLAFADAKLKKIAISGGAPVTLTVIGPASLGPISWGADGMIVYGQFTRGIMRVSANGGTPEVIVKADNVTLGAPQILPDGKSVLFTRTTPPYKVMVQSIRTGERKELFGGDTAKYLPTGHIVYALEGSILAVPFSLAKLEVTGESVPLVEGVLRTIGPHYAVSDSGTLVYVPGGAQRDAMALMLRAMRGRGAGLQIPGMQGRGRGGEAAPSVSRNIRATLVWVDQNGKEESLGAAPNFYSSPRLSPDGTKVALSITEGLTPNIWIWDLVRKTLARLTFDENGSFNPL